MHAMRPRYALSTLLGSLAIALHFGPEYGLVLAAVAILVLPNASRPTNGYVTRARAAVEAAWRRAGADRRQVAAAVTMPFAIVVVGTGLGLAVGLGWGLLAVGAMMAYLSLAADWAS